MHDDLPNGPDESEFDPRRYTSEIHHLSMVAQKNRDDLHRELDTCKINIRLNGSTILEMLERVKCDCEFCREMLKLGQAYAAQPGLSELCRSVFRVQLEEAELRIRISANKKSSLSLIVGRSDHD